MSKGVADGAPLVKCKVLASAFYEALRNELRKADATKRSTLVAVTDHSHRSAAANIRAPKRKRNEGAQAPSFVTRQFSAESALRLHAAGHW